MLSKTFLLLILCLLSVNTFASKARMSALGQGLNGSQVILDSRNAFLNPASINQLHDYVIFEWGSGGESTNTAVQTDDNDEPKAEGGFFRSVGSFVWGVYLGNESDTSFINRSKVDSATTGASADTHFLEEDNKLNMFFGGDAGMLWGMNIYYTSASDEQSNVKRKQNGIGLKLGAIVGAIDAYAHYTLKDLSEGAALGSDRYEDDGSIKAGLGYAINKYKFYIDYNLSKYTGSYNDISSYKGNSSTVTVGGALNEKLNDRATFIFSMHYELTDSETVGASNAEVKSGSRKIPIVIAIETEATSWLMLRGSVSQGVLSTEDDGTNDKSDVNTTDVAIGASLCFDNLKIDGVIGTDDAAGVPNTNETGQLHTDRLMSRVSMSYFF